MDFFFRRIRGGRNDNAGDEDSEDEEEALLADASDSNPSGEVERACAVSIDHVMQVQIKRKIKNRAIKIT